MPNALVLLVKCTPYLLGKDGCEQIIDSTRTDSNGFYNFSFKDKRKMDFGVKVARHPLNSFISAPLTLSTGQH